MIKLTQQQWTAVAVLVLNGLVLTPTVWMVSYLFNEQKQWLSDVDGELDKVRSSVSCLRAEVAKEYVTKDDLQSHADRINDRLINMMIPRKP